MGCASWRRATCNTNALWDQCMHSTSAQRAHARTPHAATRANTLITNTSTGRGLRACLPTHPCAALQVGHLLNLMERARRVVTHCHAMQSVNTCTRRARAQHAATGTQGDSVRTRLSPTLEKGAVIRASLPTYPRYPCEGHLLEGGVPLRASARNTHTHTSHTARHTCTLPDNIAGHNTRGSPNTPISDS
jgi:hypothetical protein